MSGLGLYGSRDPFNIYCVAHHMSCAVHCVPLLVLRLVVAFVMSFILVATPLTLGLFIKELQFYLV